MCNSLLEFGLSYFIKYTCEVDSLPWCLFFSSFRWCLFFKYFIGNTFFQRCFLPQLDVSTTAKAWSQTSPGSVVKLSAQQGLTAVWPQKNDCSNVAPCPAMTWIHNPLSRPCCLHHRRLLAPRLESWRSAVKATVGEEEDQQQIVVLCFLCLGMKWMSW